MFFFKIDFAS